MSHSLFTDIGVADPDTEPAGDVITDFAAAVCEWPDRAAVVHNGTAITYRDLAERVRMIGSRYRAHGFEATAARPVPIGALVSHAPAVVEHLLGILHGGATYCPIDTALPDARKQALATALGLDRLFATTEGPHPQVDLPIETIDAYTVADTELPHPHWHAGDPAYVLCTSGSTGTPKPVVVSRGALTATVRALRELFAVTPEDRVLQFASLGWDTCMEEILPALTAGATLVFDDAAHSGTFPPLLRMLADQQITVVDLPTAFWHELVLFLHEEKAALPGSVRLVVIGGERVDPTRLRQWRELAGGDIRLLNTYGCTETTMITHAVQLSGPGTETGIAADDTEAPIGRPLSHMRDHITGEGELLVSGPALATGYLGMPDITAAAFPVADHGSGNARWFRTGDVVSRGDNGLVYARGRADEQVKVLGVRIHPAEVEMQLCAHPAVAGAVVLGERLLGRTALTAYVVTASPVTAGELKRHVRERLPRQFVPTRVTFVAALSYTASGKVDRAATQRAATEHDIKGAGQ